MPIAWWFPPYELMYQCIQTSQVFITCYVLTCMTDLSLQCESTIVTLLRFLNWNGFPKCVIPPYLFNILAEMVMRETLDGFQGWLQIGGWMITNLRYADDIILLATSETELQELVDRLDRVSCRYSLLINVDKNKVMANNGIACRILIQNELLEQVDTFPYLGPLITEDGEIRWNSVPGRRSGHHCRKYGSHSIPI